MVQGQEGGPAMPPTPRLVPPPPCNIAWPETILAQNPARPWTIGAKPRFHPTYHAARAEPSGPVDRACHAVDLGTSSDGPTRSESTTPRSAKYKVIFGPIASVCG